MTTKKKIPIYFDNHMFNKLNGIYSTKIDLQKKLNSEFKKLLANPNIDEIDYSNALDEFYKQLELEKKEQNTLLLPGEKLAQLLSLDTTNIVRLQTEYKKVKDAIQPQAEDHTTFAITPQEIDRYNACVEVVKAINTSKPYINDISGPLNPLSFTRAFSPLIYWDSDGLKFKCNHNFIKNNI